MVSPGTPDLTPRSGATEPVRRSTGAPVRQIDSVALLGGARELLISHGPALYRLRVTAQGKLILTK